MSSTDPTSPSRCCVLVPVGNSIEPECERGLLVLELLGYQVRRVRGFSQIDVARNSIASSAIQDGFEETFWIDSDIGFSPDDILRIRQRNIPLCCGIYPKKGLRELACHVIPGTAEIRFGEKDGGLVEVLYAGAGFLHVRAEVYHAIERQCGLRICDARFGTPNLPYFQPLIKQTSSGDHAGDGRAPCTKGASAGATFTGSPATDRDRPGGSSLQRTGVTSRLDSSDDSSDDSSADDSPPMIATASGL